MKPISLFVLLVLAMTNVYSQNKPILIHRPITGELDSIAPVAYDTTITNAHTDFFIGNWSSDIAELEQTAPNENTFPGTNFTLRERVSVDYDVNHYPVRTSVKLFTMQNDTLFGICSGSMISRRHVLTAAHCVSSIGTNILHQDSLFVFPVIDNGMVNPNFDSSLVRKVFVLRDWSLDGEDLAILELDDPIGESTGWLSIGFNNNDSSFSEGVFYKFTYPAADVPWIEDQSFNGDTLFYKYGNIEALSPTAIGVSGASGVPGESGSSLTRIVNESTYTTYGVLSFSNNLRHSRINPSQYYAFESIIASDLETSILDQRIETDFVLFPNPTSGRVTVQSDHFDAIERIEVYNQMGKLMFDKFGSALPMTLDLSGLVNGIYFLSVFSNDRVHVTKVVVNQ